MIDTCCILLWQSFFPLYSDTLLTSHLVKGNTVGIYSIPVALRWQSYDSKAPVTSSRQPQLRGREEGRSGAGVRPDCYPAGLGFPPTNGSIDCRLPRTADAPETHDISPQSQTDSLCVACFQIQEAICSNSLKKHLSVCVRHSFFKDKQEIQQSN